MVVRVGSAHHLPAPLTTFRCGEREKMAIRYRKFNLQALVEIAVNVVGASYCTNNLSPALLAELGLTR